MLQETEEVIILGGKKEERSMQKSTNKVKKCISKNRDSVMKNVDNIIDAVAKDVSGTETGIDIVHRIREVSLSPWSSPYKNSPPKHKVMCANKILSKSNSLSKPAPACKKKIMHPSHIKIDDVISSVINNVSSECSVAAVDLFCDSPLKNLVCMGCLRHFNGKNLLANEKSEKIYSPENFR